MSQLHEIAAQFVRSGQVSTVESLGNGNINSTYLVTLSGEALPTGRFVLQKINTQIFRQPELVIQNMQVLCEHLDNCAIDSTRRWEMPRILLASTGKAFWVDEAQDYWRAITFIEESQVFETVESAEHAREVGYGLAMFHRLISTLPAERLADTLEGFHITPGYLTGYEKVLANWQAEGKSDAPRAADVQHCLDFVAQRKDWVPVLENAKAAGHLQLRPIHGDPKVNNIMLGHDGRAVSLIDLDTVKPGLVHYDIGDCLRSGCNPLGEETTDWRQVTFDSALAKAMLEGYLSLAKDFLTPQEYDYLYDGIRLIAFELGLRFFTDYLAGNVYFKVKHPEHNLDRALAHLLAPQCSTSAETAL
ncbi:MAG: aminoglycoside phosphotransferase family protein, partial [Cyanobacteria bacterium J06576_12]